jgi:hypothetical protein
MSKQASRHRDPDSSEAGLPRRAMRLIVQLVVIVLAVLLYVVLVSRGRVVGDFSW